MRRYSGSERDAAHAIGVGESEAISALVQIDGDERSLKLEPSAFA